MTVSKSTVTAPAPRKGSYIFLFPFRRRQAPRHQRLGIFSLTGFQRAHHGIFGDCLRHGTVAVHFGNAIPPIHSLCQIVRHMACTPVILLVVVIGQRFIFTLGQGKVIAFPWLTVSVGDGFHGHSVFIDLKIAEISVSFHHMVFLIKPDLISGRQLTGGQVPAVCIVAAHLPRCFHGSLITLINGGNKDLFGSIRIVMPVL